jgi:hypothetical protein
MEDLLMVLCGLNAACLMDPETRARLVAFQEECAAVLWAAARGQMGLNDRPPEERVPFVAALAATVLRDLHTTVSTQLFPTPQD